MSGNEHVASHRPREALDKYLRAFRLDPHQPLTSLCVATTLAYISTHPLTARKQDVCGKALAFFSQYCRMRILTADCDCSSSLAALQQEICYNMGCFYLELDLNHIAESFFLKAVHMTESFELSDTSQLPLTREAAFNLVTIYRNSGNETLAQEVLKAYLTFE